MKRGLARTWVALVATLPSVALACGVCVEDKVAATYDHAIVTQAATRQQLVVFGEIAGPVSAKKVGGQIVIAAPRVKGVQRGTVQTSIMPPAFSFVLDPREQSPEGATAELQRHLGTQGLQLKVIRVLR